ncbi:MAG: M17 family peptidase N-terminal domain-containing protein, partial [Alphaproteobacteria bacterium]
MFDVMTGRMTAKAVKRNAVVFATSKGKLTREAAMVDKQVGGAVSLALKGSRFDGSSGEMVRVSVKGTMQNVLVVGLGKIAGMDRAAWWKAGLGLGKQLDAMGWKDATIALGDMDCKVDATQQGVALVEGLHMAQYRFEKYKTDVKDHMKVRFGKVTLLTNASAAKVIKNAMPKVKVLLESVEVARTAANLPPNVANPQFMADEAKKLEKLGVKVEIFDEKQLTKMGCNLIMAVGANAHENDQPRLVIMKYEGAGKGKPYTAIVGKGVMFDTGGYNIKPGASMRGMKFDMCGAAAVLGAMRALAARKANVNVVGVMSCAMNMIGKFPFVMDSIYTGYKGV